MFGDFEKTNLGIQALTVDMMADNTGTIHVIWLKADGIHYGYLVGTDLVGDELIPKSASIKTKFSRPRMGVRPDGTNVHVTWSNKAATTLYCASRGDGNWETDTVWSAGGKPVNAFAANVGEDMTGTVHVIFQRWDKDPVSISKITYFYKKDNKWSNRISLFTAQSKWRDTNMFTDREGGIHIRWGRFAGPSDGYYRYAPSGALLSNSDTILIEPKAGIYCVSMGDLFVDANMNVHHAFMGYRMGAYFYVVKPAGTNEFVGYTKPSIGSIPICEPHHLDNPWPSIAVDGNGVPYVSWVEMPCPSHDPNVVKVSRLNEAGAWEVTTLDDQAHLSTESKPAMAASDTAVYVAWRTGSGSIILAVEGTPGGGGGVSFVSPANGAKVCGSVPISLQGNDGSDPIASIELFIDEVSVASVTSVSTLDYTWDTSAVAVGEHILKVVVARVSGTTAEGQITVTKDCPPTIRIASPIDGSSVFDTETIRTTVMDDIGISSVDFFVDGSQVYSDMWEPYEYAWNTQGYEDGSSHTIKVMAIDTGAQTAEDQITIKVERIYPPVNVGAEQKTNRSLFFVEYFNRVTWSPNPANSSKNVVKYRVRRMYDNSVGQVVANVNADSTLEYIDRNVDPTESFVYSITAVISRGGAEIEGKPETVSIN